MTPYLWTLTVPLAAVALAAHRRLRRDAATHEQRFDRIEKKLEELKIQADQNRWDSDKRHRRNEQTLTQLTQRSGTA